MKNKVNLNDLKTLSKNWTTGQWESYLQSLEAPCKEVLIHPEHFDKLAQTKSLSEVFTNLPLHAEEHQTNSLVQEALYKLTENQRKIILGIYWDGLSQEKLAEQMSVTPAAISLFKSTALKKLKKIMSPDLQAFLKSACTEDNKNT